MASASRAVTHTHMHGAVFQGEAKNTFGLLGHFAVGWALASCGRDIERNERVRKHAASA